MVNRSRFILLLVLSVLSQIGFAQGKKPIIDVGQLDGRDAVITTGVPFLAISPDARSAGMGDAGVAISPDANAIYWNPAKLAFLEPDFGVSGSYTPWLSSVVNDMSISYLSGYKKINEGQTLAFAMRYFDLGNIQLTDAQGGLLQLVSPREFALGATYALKLSEKFSAGLTGRFIHSNLLTGTTNANGSAGKPGISAAADVAVYYTTPIILGAREGSWSFGADISNIGPKITYQSESTADFLPTNLRLGTAFTTNLDPFNKLTFALDFSKLLVPTPTIDSATGFTNTHNDIGLLSGMFGSFSDAPGGFSEELKEIMIAAGVEYWYNDLFAVRTGYFYENIDKGGRQYFTAGIGLRYQVFGVDFAYLLPRGTRDATGSRNNPLQNTLRITLHFTMDQAEGAPEIAPDR